MQCKSCNHSPIAEIKSSGFWAAVFLIILPKCPFCLLAYGSTVALCTSSPDSSVPSQYQYSLILLVLSGLLIVISMLMRYKGIRTLIALFVSGLGMLLTLQAIVDQSSYSTYYAGVITIMLGLWFNGSMISFLQFLTNRVFIQRHLARSNKV